MSESPRRRPGAFCFVPQCLRNRLVRFLAGPPRRHRECLDYLVGGVPDCRWFCWSTFLKDQQGGLL